MEIMKKSHYEAYSAYKDSGIEWLGSMPEHWEVKRVKFISRFIYGDSLSEENRVGGDVVVYGSNGQVGTHNIANTNGPCLVIGRKGSFGKITYSDAPCFAIDTTFFVDFSSTEANIKWLFYALSCLKLDDLSHDSAVPGLNRETAHNQWLPSLSQDEQYIIVSFLDRETSKIDTLIAKKQRLIELLQEKRTALISHAVTKGLDPNVPMKDSGVEWLGKVPEHWKVKRLKYVAQINPSKSELSDIYSKTIVSFIPMELVGFGDLSLDENRSIEDVYQGFTYFRNDDVLIAKITPSFENGKGAIAQNLTNGIGFGTTELHVLRARKLVCPNYLYYLSQSHVFRIMGAVFMHGTAGQKRVEEYFIINFPTPLPPLEEQYKIVDYINFELSKIDNLITKINSAIQKLQEYRTALISAAVTGKIDVRE